MSKQLPERPNLDHLRSQAKDLLISFRSGDAEAITTFIGFLPILNGLSPADAATHKLSLHDAQSAVARQYGSLSWTDLVREVERLRALQGIDQETADRFVQLAIDGSIRRCERMVELYPGLTTYNAATALVWGDSARVKSLLSSQVFLTSKLPPNDWLPLEYVCYSCLYLLNPERAAALLECASMLLDAGADPNTAHSWRADRYEPLSVLYAAAGQTGNVDIVRLLLERGANPNDGESVYHSAQHDREEILAVLLAHGAEISKKLQPEGNTPMFFNAGHRPTDPGFDTAMKGVDWLLEHGADPNVRCGKAEETVLHCSCRIANGKLARRLLQFGADPKLKRADGRTPYDLAAMTGNLSAMEALREVGEDNELEPDVAVLSACASNDLNHAKAILENDPSVRERFPKEGGWALRKMSELGVCSGVRNLLALGADPADADEEGITALHWACFCGWLECVEELLAHGAPLEVKDKEYNANPLGWATQGTGWHRSPVGDYYSIVRALLAAGADKEQLREVMDRDEDTAVHLAELRPLLE